MTGEKILDYTVDKMIRSDVYGSIYKISNDGLSVKCLRQIIVPREEQYENIKNARGGKGAKVGAHIARMVKDAENELAIAKALSHSAKDRLVQYYDSEIKKVGEHTYHIFVVMENVTPFVEYAECNTLTIKDVIELGKAVLAGLKVCHSEKFLHRSINENAVFVDKDGKFKLGGFDVAKALKGSPVEQVERENYMDIAPELYLGKRFDCSVDIYALGMMMYRLLNRSRSPLLPNFPLPCAKADEEVAFERRLHGAIAPLPYGADNVLGEVVRKAIMPRAERYNTADEFLYALEKVEKLLSQEYLNAAVDDLQPQSTKDVEIKYSVSEDAASIPVMERKEEMQLPQDNTPIGIPQKETKLTRKRIKTFLLFGLPILFAALLIGFYLLLIPKLYDGAITFGQWITADVENIISLVYPDIDELFGASLVTIGLVIFHYVLLAALLLSLFFMARRLHTNKKRHVEAAVYRGREPYFNLAGVCVKFEKTHVEELQPIAKTLRNAAEALKFAADFGECADRKVVAAETEIGRMIDKLPDLIETCLSENTKENRKNLSDVAYALGARIQQRNQLLVK